MAFADSALPDDVADVLTNFEERLGELQQHLDPILSMPHRKLADQLTHLERAQLHVTLAYTANTLFCLYLKTQGISPSDHPVHKELERVKLYMDKVDRACDAIAHPRTHTVDVGAANRAFLHALPQLTEDQKAQLRQQAKEAKSGKPAKKDLQPSAQAKLTTSQIAAQFLQGFADAPVDAGGRDDDAGAKHEPPVGKKRKKLQDGGGAAEGHTPKQKGQRQVEEEDEEAADAGKTPKSEKKKNKKKAKSSS